MKRTPLHFIPLLVVCFVALMVIGASTSRTPLNRAYLQSPLDGNTNSITNVSSITFSNGQSISGVSVVAAVTNGDSSISQVNTSGVYYLKATNITEAKMLLSDNVTLDASSTKHGFVPKLAASTNTFLVNIGSTSEWKSISTVLAAGSNVTLNATSGVVTIHATGGGSGSGSVPLTNSVWVAKNGSDSTGARGDPSKAYLTLRGAWTNAVSGDTIFVMPGTYDERNLLKNGVNWHFFEGAKVTYTADAGAIFNDTDAGGAVTCAITGYGEFHANTNGTYGVFDLEEASSISIEAKTIDSGSADYTVFLTSTAALTITGAEISSTFSNPLAVRNAANILKLNRCKVTMLDSDNSGAALRFTFTANTNTILRDCVMIGQTSTSISSSASGSRVKIEGGYTAKGGPDGNTTIITDERRWYAAGIPYNDVIYHPTNTAPFTIDSTDFALDTNYTNGVQRAHVSASFELISTNSSSAIVALYLDQDADTSFEQTGRSIEMTSITVLTNTLTGIMELGAWLQPGAIFIFTNLSSAPATASVVAGSSQWVKQ